MTMDEMNAPEKNTSGMNAPERNASEKPTVIWLVIGITAAVGVFILIYYGLWTILDASSVGYAGFGILAAILPIILGVLTLLAAYMVYNGSGRSFLTVLLILAIIINFIMIALVAAWDNFVDMVSEASGEDLSDAKMGMVQMVEFIVQLVLAIAVFIMLHTREAKAYFRD